MRQRHDPRMVLDRRRREVADVGRERARLERLQHGALVHDTGAREIQDHATGPHQADARRR